MYGLNVIRKIDQRPEDGRLAVQEIFYTIQGEGPFSGRPAVFIRLAGCHLACTFCDTEFESGINNRMTVDQIVDVALDVVYARGIESPRARLRLPLVVLTGGEPMRQTTGPLCDKLLAAGFDGVQIETAGNLWDASLFTAIRNKQVVLVVSPKTPHVHSMVFRFSEHWKYIMRATDTATEDGLPCGPTQANQSPCMLVARPWMEGCAGLARDTTVWVSPCDEKDDLKNAANMRHTAAVAMKHGYRVSLQTHKILNLP